MTTTSKQKITKKQFLSILLFIVYCPTLILMGFYLTYTVYFLPLENVVQQAFQEGSFVENKIDAIEKNFKRSIEDIYKNFSLLKQGAIQDIELREKTEISLDVYNDAIKNGDVNPLKDLMSIIKDQPLKAYALSRIVECLHTPIKSVKTLKEELTSFKYRKSSKLIWPFLSKIILINKDRDTSLTSKEQEIIRQHLEKAVEFL
ncbi:MAG: hypothetical protein ACTSXG_02340, partial [Alphaproteobacteria bacterium]